MTKCFCDICGAQISADEYSDNVIYLDNAKTKNAITIHACDEHCISCRDVEKAIIAYCTKEV